MVSVLWEDNFVLTRQVPWVTNIHFFLTISIHCQEKRLRELIIKNDHQRENILIFYQIFSNILKGNVWRSVWRISIWIVGLTGGARVAEWWKHSPPTNVAWVQIPASTPYVGRVCCWFSPLLPEVFLRVLRFSLSIKTNSSKFEFDLKRILSAPCLNKLQLQNGKMRRSTMETKYMPHVSHEVRRWMPENAWTGDFYTTLHQKTNNWRHGLILRLIC